MTERRSSRGAADPEGGAVESDGGADRSSASPSSASAGADSAVHAGAGASAEASGVSGEPVRAEPTSRGPLISETNEIPHDIPPAPRSLLGVSAPPHGLAGEAEEEALPAKPKAERSARDAPTMPPRRSRLRAAAEGATSKRFWPRKLKFTREGKYFLGITLGVGFAAINTGNNLLYLLLGMMLSLIIVSGVMSELSLRTLTVKRRLPSRAQVKRSHLVEIEVYNDKARVPSYAIEVEDLRAGQPADKRCFFLKISPRSTQVAAYRRTPGKRGLERHTGFRIATRFPFGLFEKSREVDAADELIIYPAVDTVRLPRRGAGAQSGHRGLQGRGSGEEIYALRPMRDGDDPRDIYWRKSTVPSQMVLRERARDTRREVELRLEVRLPFMADAEQQAAQERAFEDRIREIASKAVAHVKRGDHVLIRATSGQRVASNRARGIDPLLRFLALVQAQEADSPAVQKDSAHHNREIVEEAAQ